MHLPPAAQTVLPDDDFEAHYVYSQPTYPHPHIQEAALRFRLESQNPKAIDTDAKPLNLQQAFKSRLEALYSVTDVRFDGRHDGQVDFKDVREAEKAFATSKHLLRDQGYVGAKLIPVHLPQSPLTAFARPRPVSGIPSTTQIIDVYDVLRCWGPIRALYLADPSQRSEKLDDHGLAYRQSAGHQMSAEAWVVAFVDEAAASRWEKDWATHWRDSDEIIPQVQKPKNAEQWWRQREWKASLDALRGENDEDMSVDACRTAPKQFHTFTVTPLNAGVTSTRVFENLGQTIKVISVRVIYGQAGLMEGKALITVASEADVALGMQQWRWDTMCSSRPMIRLESEVPAADVAKTQGEVAWGPRATDAAGIANRTTAEQDAFGPTRMANRAIARRSPSPSAKASSGAQSALHFVDMIKLPDEYLLQFLTRHIQTQTQDPSGPKIDVDASMLSLSASWLSAHRDDETRDQEIGNKCARRLRSWGCKKTEGLVDMLVSEGWLRSFYLLVNACPSVTREWAVKQDRITAIVQEGGSTL